jgi:hypothetical protein
MIFLTPQNRHKRFMPTAFSLFSLLFFAFLYFFLPLLLFFPFFYVFLQKNIKITQNCAREESLRKNGLKAQKPIAQGIALGIWTLLISPCKGKSISRMKGFCPYRANRSAH